MSTVPAQSRTNGEDNDNTGSIERPELTIVGNDTGVSLDKQPVAGGSTKSNDNTDCVPPTMDPEPHGDGVIRVPIDIVDDEDTTEADATEPVEQPQDWMPESVETAIKKHGFLMRWYQVYFYALLRYAADTDGVRNQLVRKYFEGHLFTHSDTLGGVVTRDRSLCITIEKAEQVIDQCRRDLQLAYLRPHDFNFVVAQYVNLVLVNKLSIDMPGRPSVGPWWMFPFRPLLRKGAFEWLNRCFQVHLNNAS